MLTTAPNFLAWPAAAPRGRAVRVGRAPTLLPRGLFLDVLVREQHRADRFDRPFALAVVTVSGSRSARPELAAAVVAALSAARRDTDVVGWIEDECALGVILPGHDASSCALVEARLTRDLASRLDASALANVSVAVRAYSGPIGTGDVGEGSASRFFDLWMLRWRTGSRDGLKRGLDVVGSCLLLTLAAPALAVIACLVKLGSPGPVLFRQPRVGRFGRPFTMLKLRTMQANADPRIHQQYVSQLISSGSVNGSAKPGEIFKIVNDPRVTRLGRFLRRTSLDELPQLWNVLRGDMALVGPRPPLPYEVERYKPWHVRRVCDAKPGITGLWQVTGRSRTTFDEMVRLDLRYARTCSAWTDIKILLATPRAVISGRGAC